MTKYYNILKGIVSVICFITALFLLVAIIYYFSDLKLNNALNLYIDDYTIPYIIIIELVMIMFSVFFGALHLKSIKRGK